MSKSTTFRVLAVVAAVLVVYGIAGFWLAPRLIRSALLKDVPAATGATAAVGEIHVNPFLLRLTVTDFSLANAQGGRLLGFQRLYVAFELSSLWHRAYTFGSIDLDGPFVNAAVAQDGRLNLLDLEPKTPPDAAAAHAPPSSVPAIRIGSFKVSQGTVSYQDASRPDVFAARLEPLNFELRDFTTGAQGGQFTFTAATQLGERIEWHGHLSVQPIESDGEFSLAGLRVHTLWEYLEDRLNFDVPSGTIDLAGTYRFSAGNGTPAAGAATAAPGTPANLHLDLATLSLSDLAIRPKNSETNWLSVPSLTIAGTAVDLATRRAHVDRVTLKGVEVDAALEPDGSINLMKLAAPPATGAAGRPATPAPKVTATAVPAATADPPWAWDVREFDLENAAVALADRTTHPEVKVALAPIDVRVTGMSQDLSKPVDVHLDVRIDGKGSLAVDGNATPQPAAADLSLKLADLDAAPLQAYVARQSSMTLVSGLLGADAKIHYGAAKGQPDMRFSGSVRVDKLHTIDNMLHDDFINWDRLEVSGVNFTQGPPRLDIDSIVVHKPYARVIIEPDDSMNVKRVMAPPGHGPAAAPAAQLVPTAQHARKALGAAPASPAAMPLAVRAVHVESGELNFSDLSIKPNFSAGIKGLSGTIVNLSSKPGARAKVDLHGSVDTFSPVSITGELAVLGPKLYTDIGLVFRNISLPIFNPYSGKFAGYNISEGKLTTELHYKVDGRALDAQHHIVIDQLEFGDKTSSKEAVSLPIRLAVSLLKDRNGVIDLSLPVTGSLDDPKFRLAPIIWKVLVNILEKAVTAPFAMLGSVFGSGPDIQFIDFKPGQSVLDDAAAEKVKSVAQALAGRPQLQIEVPIGAVPEVDGPALTAARFDSEVRAAQSGAAVRPLGELDPAAQLALLTRLYKNDFGTQPKYPDSVTSPPSKADVVAAKVQFLSQAIRDHLAVGDPELLALGQQRAQSLQKRLLTDTEVSPERVFLVGNDKATNKDGVVRLELTLK